MLRWAAAAWNRLATSSPRSRDSSNVPNSPTLLEAATAGGQGSSIYRRQADATIEVAIEPTSDTINPATEEVIALTPIDHYTRLKSVCVGTGPGEAPH